MAERTPLYDVEAEAGAHFGEVAGWIMPLHYGDVLTEYNLAREHAVLIDLSHRTKIELRGNDRVSFLQNLCTNDIAKLHADESCEAFLTTSQAKIVARMIMHALPHCLWIDAEPGLGQKIIQHLDRYLITEQVELADHSNEFAFIHLAGPRVSQPSGVPALIVRPNDTLSQPGFDIICKNNDAIQIWHTLLDQGAKPVGLNAYDILRIEAGTPEYGKDIDDSNLPQEVGRDDRAISFTKGCYLGQETVARIRSYGHVNRKLVGLKVNHADTIPAGSKLMRDGQEVGQITSSVVSPRFGTIALAYVRRGHQEPGTVLELLAGNSKLSATVSPLPFIA